MSVVLQMLETWKLRRHHDRSSLKEVYQRLLPGRDVSLRHDGDGAAEPMLSGFQSLLWAAAFDAYSIVVTSAEHREQDKSISIQAMFLLDDGRSVDPDKRVGLFPPKMMAAYQHITPEHKSIAIIRPYGIYDAQLL